MSAYTDTAMAILDKIYKSRGTPWRAGEVHKLELFLGWHKKGDNLWNELINRAHVKFPKDADESTPLWQLQDVLQELISERGELHTLVFNSKDLEYPADIIEFLELNYGTRASWAIRTAWIFHVYDSTIQDYEKALITVGSSVEVCVYSHLDKSL